MTITTYLKNDETVFHYDFIILVILTIFYLLYHKKDIFLTAHLSLHVMTIGSLGLIYMNKGLNGTLLWIHFAIAFYMFLFGYKKGFILSIALICITVTMLYGWIGESFSMEFYIRYAVSVLGVLLILFTYEYMISKTIDELRKTQESLKDMTIKDGLTTLFNRRYFDEIFPKQIKISKRNNRLLIFAMLDIDNFKNYNDTYGHQAGDDALKAVSNSFLGSMNRPDDYVFRLGGEEFGVLFQADNKKESLKVVERICKNVEKMKIAHSKNSASPFITVSIGMYIIKPTDKHDYDHIYKLTDTALYDAKQKGKNTVELYVA